MMEKKQSKRGRKPIVFDEDKIAQVEALGAFLSIEQIANYFGISKTTFYELMERQPEISERYKKGKAKAIGRIAKTLIEQACDGNITAAIFYLKTQAGWHESNQLDIVSTDGSISPTVIELVAPHGESAD